LKSRYEHTGSLGDLDRAVQAAEAAVRASGKDDPNQAMYLSHLELAVFSRYERTGELASLDRAVQLARQAVDASPEDYPDRSMYFTNLGNALSTHFERTGRMSDLDRAVEAAQEAVDAVAEDHSGRATYLSNLGVILQRRFDHTDRAGDLDRAVEVAEQAVGATPEDHPDRTRYLIGLGRGLRRRFRRTAMPSDADRALSAFREGARVVTAPADFRTTAAWEWGSFAVTMEQWEQAAEGFGAALGFAALIAPPGLERADQEFRLGDVTGLASEAAAACLQAGLPDRAVELFEQGRGVLFTQVLDSRTDLTDLRQAHPELAERFAMLRAEVDVGPAGSGLAPVNPDPGGQSAADRRRQAAAEFRQVLAEIRAMPGFERYLAPLLAAELLPAAADGPVVLINVADLRSDALVLTADGVEVIPLKGVDPEAVATRVTRFLGAVNEAQYAGNSPAGRATAELQLSGVLGWLWDKVTGPVLDHLGYTATQPEGAVWPRVWWCPSGLLALLPLHAAGYHDLAGQRHEAVIDRIVSSTIPTIRALLNARRGGAPVADGRVLVVAMAKTPERPDLPGAAREASALQQLFGKRADLLGVEDTPPATYGNVMATLSSHSWAHFSCHGEIDLTDPSSSRLLLADYQTRPLTVLDLTHARLKGMELAFLSACATARAGSKLPDEPIHLAAACQLAGYRHVIASLWPIGMTDTAWLTTYFYRSLTPAGAASSDAASTAAIALHNGVRRLRSIYRTSPSRWAPYSHTGP
jgi:tetratricopeptide (TPR) repeat protein